MKHTLEDLTIDTRYTDAAITASAAAAAAPLRKSHTRPVTDPENFTPDWVPKHSPRTTTQELGQHLKHLLITDRRDALDTLKTMPVGKSFYVEHTHTNNLRVACHYQRKTFLKTYRTETVEYNKRLYLRVTRTR